MRPQIKRLSLIMLLMNAIPYPLSSTQAAEVLVYRNSGKTLLRLNKLPKENELSELRALIQLVRDPSTIDFNRLLRGQKPIQASPVPKNRLLSQSILQVADAQVKNLPPQPTAPVRRPIQVEVVDHYEYQTVSMPVYRTVWSEAEDKASDSAPAR